MRFYGRTCFCCYAVKNCGGGGGNPCTKVTIFEYASLSCSHCADFHANTLPRLKSAYIDTGKVNLVFRDFPLNEPALRASMLVRCVGKEKGSETFYKYMRALFASQETWAFDQVNFKGTLANIARLGGTDKAAFDACMANADIEKIVLQHRKIGSDIGVNSTPTFFINGKMLQGGKAFEEFKAEIDPLLKAK